MGCSIKERPIVYEGKGIPVCISGMGVLERGCLNFF